MINSSLMEELDKTLQEWNKKGILLLRLDYGYPVPFAFDYEISLAASTHADLIKFIKSLTRPAVLRLSSSEYLFSQRRRNSRVDELLAQFLKCGVIVETRFPKSYIRLKKFLDERDIPYSCYDCPAEEEIPPLYSRLRHGSEMLNFHLRHEWQTGLDMARGTSVVIEIANLISQKQKPVTISALAEQMGITLGAAASYLRWMEDAALIRKVDKGFQLRHPGLNSLFGSTSLLEGHEAAVRKIDPMDLD
jgi:hypothetical protein